MASEAAVRLWQMQQHQQQSTATTSRPAVNPGSTPRQADYINSYDYALAKKRVAQYKQERRGLDGVLLQEGQSGPGVKAAQNWKAALAELKKANRELKKEAEWLRSENEILRQECAAMQANLNTLREIARTAFESSMGGDWLDKLKGAQSDE